VTAAVQNWAPAAADALDEFVAGYTLGFGDGCEVGWFRGREENDRAWQLIFTGYAATIAQPTQHELAARRQPTDDPCPARCRACSRCVRFEQAHRNRARYGGPDFPGARASCGVDPW